jgi:hypothetical protein
MVFRDAGFQILPSPTIHFTKRKFQTWMIVKYVNTYSGYRSDYLKNRIIPDFNYQIPRKLRDILPFFAKNHSCLISSAAYKQDLLRLFMAVQKPISSPWIPFAFLDRQFDINL